MKSLIFVEENSQIMKKSYNNKAFSLIELSIVVLIIGILIAGVVEGSYVL
ncbi:MAG: prepilin-type N-terminal cleavage/methylation domain-containing protein [Pelagibacterales bacterium]|nr:prepilin-type N-terminal cleavage/methylation domain-containing protein [Pelagibacterales bacterium]